MCRLQDDKLTQIQSPYWKHFGENVRIKKKATRLAALGRVEEAITVMEAFFATTPSDRKAARQRLQLYENVKRREQGYPLVADYQPYFLKFREPNQLAIPQLSEKCAQLKRMASSFVKSSNSWLHIREPLEGDLIAGPTAVEMIIKDNNQFILSIDAFLDGQRVASIENPPARLIIDPPNADSSERARRRLSAVLTLFGSSGLESGF